MCLMTCFDDQICVWNKCTGKVWREFEGKIWINTLLKTEYSYELW
jgi:hypothetical protein